MPTFQVVIPVRPAHALLTIHPLPNNPDIPTQKFRLLKQSPYSNPAPRQALVDKLNSVLPPKHHKESGARDKMFKLPWELFADAVHFGNISEILDEVIRKVRRELPPAGTI